MEERREVELDPELWNRLPTELLERVLGKLALTSLLSFRAVSQQWESMIEGPRLFYEGSPGKPVLFYFDPSPGCSEWSPSLFFPDSGTKSWKREELPRFHLRETVLVAADGGLLCFSSDRTADTFVIYNPLSKDWREVTPPSSVLPKLPRGSVFEDACTYVLVGLAVDRKTGDYNLLVAGIHEDSTRDALMYDSSTEEWTTCASVPPVKTFCISGEWIDGKWSSERSLCCGGNLYWLVHESDNRARPSQREGLLKYSLKEDEWAVVQEPVPCEESEFHIVSHDGNLVLFKWFDKDRFRVHISNMPSSELQPVGSQIKELSQVDSHRSTDVVSNTNDGTHALIKFITEGDCLYTVYEPSDRPESEEWHYRVAKYNMRTSVFTWLPPIFSVPSANRLWAFAPSLRAFV